MNQPRDHRGDNEEQSKVFDYLSVLTSVIIGFGLSNLLAGYASLIQAWRTVVPCWLYFAWIILLLPLYFIYWWSFWDYRKQVKWTFFGFSFLLSGPIVLYIVTSLLLPSPTVGASFNSFIFYLNVRHWMFGLWIILQIWGILLAPYLKTGFKWGSFFNSYKFAQYILLAAFTVGLFSSGHSLAVDAGILVIFYLVLIYLMNTHRRTLARS
jgi:hypothetical protein